MKLPTSAPPLGRLRLSGLAVAAALVVSAGGLLVTGRHAQAAAVAVPLGTAESFVVLAGAGITNTGPTVLTGDIGSFPNPAITGTGTMTITGTNHAGDNVTQEAKKDLVTAYNVAAGEKPPTPITDDLGGKTLTQGVYNSASSIGLTGALTLDAEGDAGAVFVFQAGSTLKTATSSSVVLTNGAQACNVFWQVGSSATIGTATQFRGTVLALTSITMDTGATAVGRMLARTDP
ncbi:ice-binding family protein [Kribbella jejuensis]|uniref:ice-binding family protein n=1 Tax=Kribbella jejuensis TaxID=236068 RepID=UPI001152412A|nr:ice-binding family protein [Kribbella jejuensis]